MNKSISTQIREHIKKSGMTPYRIALESKVDRSVVHRFYSEEKSIMSHNLDAIAEVLGLKLVKNKK